MPYNMYDAVEDTASAIGSNEDLKMARRAFRNARIPAAVRKPLAKVAGSGFAMAGIEGAAKSFNDMHNGVRDQWMQQTLGGQPQSYGGMIAADTGRVLENVGNAATYDMAGRVGGAIGSAAAELEARARMAAAAARRGGVRFK